jgi:hypothetical protein
MKTILLLGAFIGLTSQINAQTTIFNETFETNSPTVNSWTLVDNDGDSQNWGIDDEPANTDPWGYSGRIYVSISAGTTPDNLLVSPVITLPAGSNLSLSYQIGSFFPSLPDEHYAVYVLPASAVFMGTEAPVTEETLTANEASVANTRTVDISGSAGQDVKIYFRHYSTNNQLAIILDNVNITQNVLATSETSGHNNMGIYPNPTWDYLNVKTQSKIVNLEVYDMTGRKINVELNDNKIDVRNLQSGNYILKIETKEGIKTEKFIKK